MSDLVAYASRTGTIRNLASLRAAAWRILVSAAGKLSNEGFRYALDNGAWSAFQQGRPFDDRLFGRALSKLGRDADWVVIPDVVAGGRASFDLSIRWMRSVLDSTERGLLAVQDGMTPAEVVPIVGARVGIFVGGSTAWKIATMAEWARIGRLAGAWVHVGRVNSARRIRMCALAGVRSFDGTSASRYAKTLPLLDAARRQGVLDLSI